MSDRSYLKKKGNAMLSNACDALVILLFTIILSLSLTTMGIVIFSSNSKCVDAERDRIAIDRLENEIAHLWAAHNGLDYLVRLEAAAGE